MLSPDRPLVYCGPDPDHGEFVDPTDPNNGCRACPQTCNRDLLLLEGTVLYFNPGVVGNVDTEHRIVVSRRVKARKVGKTDNYISLVIVDEEASKQRTAKHSPSQILYMAVPVKA